MLLLQSLSQESRFSHVAGSCVLARLGPQENPVLTWSGLLSYPGVNQGRPVKSAETIMSPAFCRRSARLMFNVDLLLDISFFIIKGTHGTGPSIEE